MADYVRLKPGCRIYQGEFEFRGIRKSFTTGETSRPAAVQKLREKRREVELKYAAEEMARHAQLAGLPPPSHVASAGGGCTAQHAAKEYWHTKGQHTQNADALDDQIECILDLIGRKTDLSVVDDFAMLKFKTEIIRRGPRGNSRTKGKFRPSSINEPLKLIFRIWNFAGNMLHCVMRHQLHPDQWLEPDPINTIEMGFFEQMRLQAVCEKLMPELIPIYEFAIDTAARREAFCTLTWNQIEWEQRRIVVALKGKGNVKKQHRISLTPSALRILTTLQALDGRHKACVFTTILKKDSLIKGKLVKAGTRIPLDPKRFSALMRQMFDAAGLPHLRAGHLRHTGATRLLRVKDMSHVQAHLGHTTQKCTARYAALVREDLENAVVLFDAIQTEARKKVMAALRDASSLDTALAMMDVFNKNACAAAKERLRKDAQAATFAFATAA